MSNIFVYFNEKSNIKYSYLITLYLMSEFNKKNNCSIIIYRTITELLYRFNDVRKCFNLQPISNTTLNRFLNSESRYGYFDVNKDSKTIVLNNNFISKSGFIVLTDKEQSFLLKYDNQLLFKYYTYLKYYCGYSKSKSCNITAKQFLNAIEYSSSSNSTISKISGFNNLLLNEGLISIHKFRDNNGRERNLYTIK